MPVSYKRKNSMKKSKSSKGSKSSKLSKRVKTRKSTKTKKRLMRKSKNRSVVRKMRGGVDPDDVLRAIPANLTFDELTLIITDLQSLFRFSQTNKYYWDLINENLMQFINTIFKTLPPEEKAFIEIMRTNMDRFTKLILAEIMLLFKYYNKLDFTNTFKQIYNIDDDIVFNKYLDFMKNKIEYLYLIYKYEFNNLIKVEAKDLEEKKLYFLPEYEFPTNIDEAQVLTFFKPYIQFPSTSLPTDVQENFYFTLIEKTIENNDVTLKIEYYDPHVNEEQENEFNLTLTSTAYVTENSTEPYIEYNKYIITTLVNIYNSIIKKKHNNKTRKEANNKKEKQVIFRKKIMNNTLKKSDIPDPLPGLSKRKLNFFTFYEANKDKYTDKNKLIEDLKGEFPSYFSLISNTNYE